MLRSVSKISLIFALLVSCVTVAVVPCGSPDSTYGNGDSAAIGVQFDVRPVAAVYHAMATTFPNVAEGVKPFQNLTTDVALALGFRYNIIIVASGLSAEQQLPFILNGKFYAVAASIAKLCSTLSTMEKCFEILIKSSLETGYFVSRGGLKENFHSETAEYLANKIETKIEKNAQLSAIYKQIKLGSPSEYVDLAEADEIGRRELGRTAVKFMLYKMHVRHSYGNISSSFEKAYYVTARSVFELAKQPCKTESLQVLYDQAIVEVLNSWDNKLENAKVILDTPSVLYAKLEEKISASVALKDDYEKIKQTVGETSKWMAGLFNVNSLPL